MKEGGGEGRERSEREGGEKREREDVGTGRGEEEWETRMERANAKTKDKGSSGGNGSEHGSQKARKGSGRPALVEPSRRYLRRGQSFYFFGIISFTPSRRREVAQPTRAAPLLRWCGETRRLCGTTVSAITLSKCSCWVQGVRLGTVSVEFVALRANAGSAHVTSGEVRSCPWPCLERYGEEDSSLQIEVVAGSQVLVGAG